MISCVSLTGQSIKQVEITTRVFPATHSRINEHSLVSCRNSLTVSPRPLPFSMRMPINLLVNSSSIQGSESASGGPMAKGMNSYGHSARMSYPWNE
jgi:hypothetical protein